MKKLLCAILAMALVILPVGGSMVAYAEDAADTVQVKTASYKTADYSGETGTCYWYIEDGILYFEPQDGVSGTLGNTDYAESERPWYKYRTEIEGVQVLEGISAGTDLTYFFDSLYNAEYIRFADDFDTSSVEYMRYMFQGCSGLTDLDLSSFDTSSVEDMGFMFSGCSALTELDLSSFDTSSAAIMSCLFYGCSSLTTLDLSSFDLSSIELRTSMFEKCSSLKSIALGKSWNWTYVGGTITSEEEGLLPEDACWSKLESSENGTNTYDSSYGELTSQQLAAQWTSDYAGTWVKVNAADDNAADDISDDNNSSGGGSTSLLTQKINVKKSQLTKTIHTKKLKKKNQTFKLKASTSGNGKITYKKVKGNKKIKVSKAGKVTVKKGLKKGKTYKVKVKVTAAKTLIYKKATKTVTLKIKIK